MAIQPGRDEAAFQCEIHRTDNYIERLSLRPVPPLPAQVLLEISSQVLTAKDPLQWQVRYRALVSRACIERLHDLLAEWRRHEP